MSKKSKEPEEQESEGAAAPEAAEGEGAPKKGKKKLVFIAAGVALLVVCAGGFGVGTGGVGVCATESAENSRAGSSSFIVRSCGHRPRGARSYTTKKAAPGSAPGFLPSPAPA